MEITTSSGHDDSDYEIGAWKLTWPCKATGGYGIRWEYMGMVGFKNVGIYVVDWEV